jgi:hypothetical protein
MQDFCFLMSVVVLAFSGCWGGVARFDASNDKAVKSSMARMTAGMNEQQKKQLSLDMMACAGPELMKTGSVMFKSLHGMSVAEIHDKAEAARAEMKK